MNSSFVLFGREIRGQKLPLAKLKKLFFKKVERADYSMSDIERIVKHFWELNNA